MFFGTLVIKQANPTRYSIIRFHKRKIQIGGPETFTYFYVLLALTRKICGILSKKLQKLALLKLLSNLSVKTTLFCYFFLISHKFYRFRLVVDINIIT